MFRKILVPLDGSPRAESALTYATTLAEQFDAQLLLLRIVPPVAVPVVEYDHTQFDMIEALEQRQMEEASAYLQRMSKEMDVAVHNPHTLRRQGEVSATILEVAESENMDLIVMATHGRGGLSRWILGSVADRVMRASPVPVLLVRASMLENLVEGRGVLEERRVVASKPAPPVPDPR